MAQTLNPIIDGYIPPDHVETTAQLHREAVEDVDPISYEVIRHALWNINIEHGQTILKVSGSPVALYSHDFNPAITGEEGELVYFGQYVQHLCAGAPSGVKWTLENRSENPGINPGDIFLCNDPWIAVNHQLDAVLLKPVFWEGKIFAWVTSTLHQYDIGGTTPGSFCPDALDIFYESSPIPPIKIVENDEIQVDVEEMFLRKSRLPDLVGLDLRAMIAGCNVAERRILGLCEKYGAPVVKGVMRKISDNSEEVFLSRLRTIPDGVWRDRSFLEMALPGDDKIYEIVLSVTKEGDELIFSNEGTDPQAGAINTTIIGFRGAIMTGLIGAFLYDQLFAYGGPMRHISFRPEPGTLTCARHPASVSCSPNTSMLVVLAQANSVISQMISCSSDESLRREATGKFGASQFPILSLAGTDQWGGPFATVLLDPMLSGIGAMPHRDGVSTGGYPFDPKAIAPNVEFNEQFFPILYLNRNELPDSAGAGRFRGGASAAWSFVPHGTDQIAIASSTSGVLTPTATGIWGGGTGTTTGFRLAQNSDVHEQFEAGRIPDGFDGVKAEVREIEPKEVGVVQGPDDVLEIRYPGAAGQGDPLERDPELVLEDVQEGYVTVEGAEQFYQVAINGEGEDATLDSARTAELREAERQRRLTEGKKQDPAAAPKADYSGVADGVVDIADIVRITFKGGEAVFSCQSCEAELGRNLVTYKAGALVMERTLDERVPLYSPSNRRDAAQLRQREHYCPGCARRFSAEMARESDQSLVEVEVHGLPEEAA